MFPQHPTVHRLSMLKQALDLLSTNCYCECLCSRQEEVSDSICWVWTFSGWQIHWANPCWGKNIFEKLQSCCHHLKNAPHVHRGYCLVFPPPTGSDWWEGDIGGGTNKGERERGRDMRQQQIGKMERVKEWGSETKNNPGFGSVRAAPRLTSRGVFLVHHTGCITRIAGNHDQKSKPCRTIYGAEIQPWTHSVS